ncbi:MAG: ABC transporter substrate-binding protein, partial [Acidimicrobiia bacterium]|nr:ABC transporter substrate-binding protein [Acidimicrobiia bacterium]
MSRLTKILSLLFAMALVASACGGGDDDDSAEGGEETETELAGGGIDNEAAEEALASTTTVAEGEAEEETAAAGSIEELEAQWADARAAVVAELNSGDYGVGDDNILRGPGGFEVDMSTCPSDWSDTQGLEGSIKIGHTTALSGNLAAYGNIAQGMETYFNYVNDVHGGIGGLPLELIVKDDGYVATQTIELVDELIQSDKPFFITTLGSPNTLATYDTLNSNCIPQPFVMTGHPAWGDPENHPFTAGLQMSYSTEAILWGNWIKENMADQLPVKVAGLVMDNDFGLAYQDGFEKWAEQNPDVVSEFQAVPHDPAAPTVTNEMTTIAAGDPDVFISMTAGNPCLLAVQEAGNSGLTTDGTVLFAPSVCKDPNAYMIPAGDAADGWNIVGGGIKATTDPQYADEPFIKFLNETLDAAGIDTSVGLYGTGFGMFAWAHVEALRIAAELD